MIFFVAKLKIQKVSAKDKEGVEVSNENSKKATKPITYYYNPFYNLNDELQFLEVWQVLEDDVLGSLYPWQYVATAETSNRIVSLNFLALKNFENDYRKYYDQLFVYRVSAKLLSEGNVHRLGQILQSNLILCFDIYQLEKFGDKNSMQGIKFLQNIGATIMISGVDKAPVDVLLKYQANYYLLDYRYYNEQNKGLISMMKQLADTNAVTLVVGNVNSKNNIDLFADNGIEIFSGSVLARPRKKIDKFVENVDRQELVEDDTKQKFVIKDVDAPEVKDRKKGEQIEEVTLNVTSAREMFKARLAGVAQRKVDEIKAQDSDLQKAKEPIKGQEDKELVKGHESKKDQIVRKPRNAPLQLNKQNKAQEPKEVNKEAKPDSILGKGSISTSTDEFASLNKNKTNQKETKRGENVIKLNISKPNKKR